MKGTSYRFAFNTISPLKKYKALRKARTICAEIHNYLAGLAKVVQDISTHSFYGAKCCVLILLIQTCSVEANSAFLTFMVLRAESWDVLIPHTIHEDTFLLSVCENSLSMFCVENV